MAADHRLTGPDGPRAHPAGPSTPALNIQPELAAEFEGGNEFESEEELARRLRETHRRVRALGLPPERRDRLARRLLAICDVSKRDLAHAGARLSVFLRDLAVLESESHPAGGPESLSDGASDTPSRRNFAHGD
ncbi:hypothetical protein [Spongiactinospora sp. TRM90649]|uniref:hypothetical protein n=1 Tax=Spongiactinospora sp. TRM90649 TaxID=3031114 RepID=UPI0023F8CD22|nr:hypothetical protein [Spongiactinospora sp. TRM90649]MDF5753343.1 hypothetical protein [Spongiactinospora sp. TRM90649]